MNECCVGSEYSVPKTTVAECIEELNQGKSHQRKRSPVGFQGSTVLSGDGKMLVIAVGDRTLINSLPNVDRVD